MFPVCFPCVETHIVQKSLKLIADYYEFGVVFFITLVLLSFVFKIIKDMAKIQEDFLSGTIGPVVAAKWKDIKYLRTLPKGRKSEDWSDKQKAHRKCFAAVNAFAKSSRSSLIKPIWNLAAYGHFSGYNLFIKANKPAFEPAGELSDPRLLKLTTGNLPLPLNIEAVFKRNKSVSVEISWENPSSLEIENNSDQLMVIFYRKGFFTKPIETGFTRDKKDVEIILPEEWRDIKCVFVFFKNKKGDDYSDSFAIKV